MSYHDGSIWPHDNAICAAGLARRGHTAHAGRVIAAQLGVASPLDGASPELFAGFRRDAPRGPAAHPTSCSPQAWDAPHLPPSAERLRLHGIRFGVHGLSVSVDDDVLDIETQDELDVACEPRPPPATAFESR